MQLVREAYREVFSRHIFFHPDVLYEANRFTLEPLKAGHACLTRADLGRAYSAFLNELVLENLFDNGTNTFRYADVFKQIEEHLPEMLTKFKMVSARFFIRAGKEKFRLEVNPGKDTLGGDKNNTLALRWLKGCGFEK
jgi:hypothetical protein